MGQTEVNGYYRKDGKFVCGHFRKGFLKSDLLPPDKFMKDYYPVKKDGE